MRHAQWIYAGLAGVMLTGCSNMDVITKKQMETENRLEQILQTNAATNAQLADLSREVQELKKVTAGQAADMESLRADQKNLQATVEAIPKQPVAVAPPVPQIIPQKIELVNTEAAKADKDAPQQEAYMKAFGVYSANRYSEAITAFTEFIAAHPGSEYAGNAQYWIGECHYTRKEYKMALSAFNAVLEKYPKSNKVPDAMLKVAFTRLSLNDQPDAKSMLRKLIDTYPKSPAAAKARERLSRL